MISIKQIVYALAVEKTKHFKKAADECAISQSALSTAIAELESQLGFQIFERDNKKVLITAIGQLFLNKARLVKLQVDELHQLAQIHAAPFSAPLSLGVIPTIGPYLLPKVLPAVRKQYPQLRLKIVEEQSPILVEKVRSGELDTAILALPYDIDGLHAFEFWQEDFYWITHRSDERAKQTEIASAELKQSHLLLLKEGHCLKDHALAVCHFKPTATDESMSGTSLYTLVQMVAGRMGTTIIPEMALSQFLHRGSELKAVHINEPGPHRKIAFITRLNYVGVNNIQLMMKLFRQQLSNG